MALVQHLLGVLTIYWIKSLLLFSNNATKNYSYYNCSCSQQTFTCSKSTIKTLSRCEICLKITMKTPEWCHWRCSGIFLVNFEHISHLFLVSLQMFASVVWLVPIHFLPPNSQARKNTTLHLNMHKTSVSIRRTGWWSI